MGICQRYSGDSGFVALQFPDLFFSLKSDSQVLSFAITFSVTDIGGPIGTYWISDVLKIKVMRSYTGVPDP